MGHDLLIYGVYWGCNPLTITIQVCCFSHFHRDNSESEHRTKPSFIYNLLLLHQEPSNISGITQCLSTIIDLSIFIILRRSVFLTLICSLMRISFSTCSKGRTISFFSVTVTLTRTEMLVPTQASQNGIFFYTGDPKVLQVN